MWQFIAIVLMLVTFILTIVGIIAVIHYLTKNIGVTDNDDDSGTNTPHQSMWH
jgi:hypothetical protein